MKIHGVLIALVIAGTIPPALAASGTPTGVNLTYAQPLSTPAIRDVQKRLHKLGVYKGSIDGNWGSSSQAALKQFQQTHGLQVTGQLNDATVKTLNVNLAKLLGISPPKSTPNGPNQPQTGSANNGQTNTSQGTGLSRQAIRTVQHRLRQLNFDVGPADGIWGADTQKALTQFQQGHALQPTGQLNPATISALGLNSNRLLMPKNQQ